MGCLHTRNSHKSRIIIYVMELKYYIYIFNQSVIWRVKGDPLFAAFERQRRSVICGVSRVRGDPSFAVIEVERVKTLQFLSTDLIFALAKKIFAKPEVSFFSKLKKTDLCPINSPPDVNFLRIFFDLLKFLSPHLQE